MNCTSQLFIAFLFITLTGYSQAPQAFKYQAVIRDTSGTVIINQLVSLKISILKNDINGESVYEEIHDITTNQLGIINLEIGRGLVVEGEFDQIPWGEYSFFIRLELDAEGGMNYLLLGISQLLSVPYALYAEHSGSDTLQTFWKPAVTGIYYDDGNIGIGTTEPDSSALLDLSSENKGFLPPRMNKQQILAISNPADGLMVYCTSDDKFYAYTKGSDLWREILFGTGTIVPPFPCGDSSITVNHIAGIVAPVSKTVTYNTVSNIPGEPSKCWITQNLGASHKAYSVDDDSETSAGWYWQFNKKQGYMHDGTTRTPDTYWNESIDEYSDWLASNDPCTLEIGNNWRLPTYSEFYNIDISGSWNDWNGPWNSPLKLHAAGYLFESNGALMQRGSTGGWWSSSEENNVFGRYLYIRSEFSYMNSYFKGYAQTLRCVTE
jgi:hypothetical protein